MNKFEHFTDYELVWLREMKMLAYLPTMASPYYSEQEKNSKNFINGIFIEIERRVCLNESNK